MLLHCSVFFYITNKWVAMLKHDTLTDHSNRWSHCEAVNRKERKKKKRQKKGLQAPNFCMLHSAADWYAKIRGAACKNMHCAINHRTTDHTRDSVFQPLKTYWTLALRAFIIYQPSQIHYCYVDCEDLAPILMSHQLCPNSWCSPSKNKYAIYSVDYCIDKTGRQSSAIVSTIESCKPLTIVDIGWLPD